MLRSVLELTLGKRLPIVTGTIEVPGVEAPITIRRDAHGIAYVEASSAADAFFGAGFCQAQDRGFQIELYLRVARGTLAEVLGADMLPVDRLSRRLDFRGIARRQLAVLPSRDRAQLASFARGLNAGIVHGAKKRPHELALLGMTASRLEETDIIGVLQFFAFALSSNWDAELSRLRILRTDGAAALHALEHAPTAWTHMDYGIGTLAADVDALAAAEALATEVSVLGKVTGLVGASNAWALAPSRTATGRAILACDPHLSPALPSPWYLLHVRCEEWTMGGAFLPGNPIPTFGHNDHVAWAITAGHVDNTDLFIEKIGPDAASVREGDRWRACEVREEVIAVKGRPSVTERVLVTPRGPIVSPILGEGRAGLSLRATWMAARPIGGYDLYDATSVTDACARFASYPALSENRVFADVEGHIAWHVVGDTPVRRRGGGMLPSPGWDDSFGWEDDPLPFEALPHRFDPPEGFVASANQHPGPSPRGDFLGADWLDGSRYERIVELLGARCDWDLEATARMQLDRKTKIWGRLREPVLAALRKGDARAHQWLEAWDGVVAPESTAAAVFEVFFAEMLVRVAKCKAPRSWRAAIGQGTNVVLPHGNMALRRIDHLVRLLVVQPDCFFAHGWPAEMRLAARAAMQMLRRTNGNDDRRWAWGRVRPLHLVHAVGSKQPLDRIWNRGPLAFGGDATTIPQGSVVFDAPLGNAIGIPNMRMVLDIGNWESSRFILAGGQSGNPLSPHYDDMIAPWLRGDSVSMAWSSDSVRERATHVLRLFPGTRVA